MVLINNKYHSVNTSPTREIIIEIGAVCVCSFFLRLLFDAFKWIQVWMLIWTPCTFYILSGFSFHTQKATTKRKSFVKILFYLWNATRDSLPFDSPLNAPLRSMELISQMKRKSVCFFFHQIIAANSIALYSYRLIPYFFFIFFFGFAFHPFLFHFFFRSRWFIHSVC